MDKVKPNLEKPFSIEAYEAGAEFCNADGYKRRVLAVDVPGGSPIIACDEHGHIFRFGMRSDSTGLDLFEILPEPTHREDGSPLDIPPLPEVEGWKGVYLNSEDLKREWANGMMWSCFMEFSNRWGRPMTSHPQGDCEHYILYTPIAKPTTIEDLFADGPVCWVHNKDGGVRIVNFVSNDKDHVYFSDPVSWFSLDRLSELGSRYSNSPLTKWEDAKPFIGKEDSNEQV